MSALPWVEPIGGSWAEPAGAVRPYAGAPATGVRRPASVRPSGRRRTVATATPGPSVTSGRARAFAAAVVLAVAALLGIGTSAMAGAEPTPHHVTVRAGQTLGEIAARELPDRSLSAGVVAIQVANGLSSTTIRPGQVLAIPTS